jgi:putative ABC transport system permease protein
MLASVNERRREIGIRMAIGAARRDILAQFVGEAVVLCGAGGAAGVLLGIGVVYGTAAWSGIPAGPGMPALTIALLCSLLVGLFFGVAPAMRAAATDPAAAFRHAT